MTERELQECDSFAHARWFPLGQGAGGAGGNMFNVAILGGGAMAVMFSILAGVMVANKQ